jgi:hypothetical protein
MWAPSSLPSGPTNFTTFRPTSITVPCFPPRVSIGVPTCGSERTLPQSLTGADSDEEGAGDAAGGAMGCDAVTAGGSLAVRCGVLCGFAADGVPALEVLGCDVLSRRPAPGSSLAFVSAVVAGAGATCWRDLLAQGADTVLQQVALEGRGVGREVGQFLFARGLLDLGALRTARSSRELG